MSPLPSQTLGYQHKSGAARELLCFFWCWCRLNQHRPHPCLLSADRLPLSRVYCWKSAGHKAASSPSHNIFFGLLPRRNRGSGYPHPSPSFTRGACKGHCQQPHRAEPHHAEGLSSGDSQDLLTLLELSPGPSGCTTENKQKVHQGLEPSREPSPPARGS